MPDEPITTEHLVRGAVQPKTGIKAFVFGLWWIGFILLGFMVYKTFFQKTAQQIIVAKRGSEVQVTQINKVKRTFVPFVEVGVGQTRGDSLETFIRTGVRFEW